MRRICESRIRINPRVTATVESDFLVVATEGDENRHADELRYLARTLKREAMRADGNEVEVDVSIGAEQILASLARRVVATSQYHDDGFAVIPTDLIEEIADILEIEYLRQYG